VRGCVADTRLLLRMSGRLYSRTPLIGDITGRLRRGDGFRRYEENESSSGAIVASYAQGRTRRPRLLCGHVPNSSSRALRSHKVTLFHFSGRYSPCQSIGRASPIAWRGCHEGASAISARLSGSQKVALFQRSKMPPSADDNRQVSGERRPTDTRRLPRIE
jgi:hypothetical protein